MKYFIGQLVSLIGAIFALACCFGLPLLLTALTAVGLGFLIRDAYLLPLFIIFILLNLWLLYLSTRGHGAFFIFWLGLIGGILSFVGLALLILAGLPLTWMIILGLAVLLIASIWDFIIGLRLRK